MTDFFFSSNHNSFFENYSPICRIIILDLPSPLLVHKYLRTHSPNSNHPMGQLQTKMPGNKESIISSQGPEPQKWPYYKIHDKEAILSDRQGSFKVHTILIDSDEGRAYEKLTTDAERLDYMRKHSVDSWWVVQADTVSFEDNVAGKRYEIKKNSDEYKGLKKLLKKDGSTPDPGTKEWDKMVRYYKEHATTIADVPVNTSDSCAIHK
ncbi:hypothetical protein BKA67DRAFT_573538 [Truncatella angustata]|uniref:Uncharacterized protein n=1 Tax=Truncatella angustata TaxID=152316 RepID=A0A9P8UHP6_9PEZI|nr:uncharacterized protein BKA67DRAFT_573538 [Truncatella angustata]KAH6652303.1 hypothetical protein BKA67DRAFT_573538 [Truncatella angustata]